MEQTITSERAMLLVAALVDAVRRHVADRKVLDAIGGRWSNSWRLRAWRCQEATREHAQQQATRTADPRDDGGATAAVDTGGELPAQARGAAAGREREGGREEVP